MPVDPHCDDTLLSRVLISTWALHTGRRLRRDAPPCELPAEELINFWADPLMEEPSAAGPSPAADPPAADSPNGAAP
jgi:hypothetical protein